MIKITISLSIALSAVVIGRLPLQAQNSPHTFDARMQLSLDRLTSSRVSPMFTSEFILADVSLDPNYPRRFYNFSGDLSGRYLEVMSLFPHYSGLVVLDSLVAKLLRYQRPDGRFGDVSLAFTAEEIGGEHMALLWGNGRLLVGLMQYYEQTQDERVLSAGRKLGDFFLQTYAACATPAVREKLADFGAKGIICFTQYIEGLVALARHTGDTRYTEAAARTYRVLPPPGQQHSHGYLTTLRGVLNLYEYTQDTAHLGFVQRAYDDLVHSDNYTAFGSVPEYFGGKGSRDEGCSTADFMRLSFHLYRLTGEPQYLDYGEFALHNAFYFNQYFTGDFGHHFISEDGAKPFSMMAAWWCCTMHGLRAMRDVQNHSIVTTHSDRKRIELYLETTYQDEDLAYEMRRTKTENDTYTYRLKFAQPGQGLAFRQPPWAERIQVVYRGNPVSTTEDGYIILDQPWTTGDSVDISLTYRKVILSDKRQPVALSDLEEQSVKGTLQYGPYLMGVDGHTDPIFTAEPASNVVFAGSLQPATADRMREAGDIAIGAQYQHGGYPSQLATYLRPVAGQTFRRHGPLKMRMDFTKGSPSQSSQEMLNPWQPR